MVRKYTQGFALPTVMIAAVIMMMLLLSGLVATTSISSTVRVNHYDKMARLAANAGIEFVENCFSQTEIPTSGPYTPKSTSCTNSSDDSSKSLYLIDKHNTNNSGTSSNPQPERVRATYSVAAPVNLSNGYYSVTSTGTVTVHRPNGDIAKTVTAKRNLKLYYANYVASTSDSGVLFVCGIISSKTYCWGRNQEAQLGNGTIDTSTQGYETDTATGGNNFSLGLWDNNKPVLTPVIRSDNTYGITSGLQAGDIDLEVATGNGFACALAADSNLTFSSRHIVCWGTSTYGETTGALGGWTYPTRLSGSTYAPWEYDNEPTDPKRYPIGLVAADTHVCVITGVDESDPGYTYCWGRNDRGQLGRGSTSAQSRVPQKVNTLGNGSGGIGGISKLDSSVPANHTCGLQGTNNKVVCWGINFYGEIGDGTSYIANGSSNLSKTYPREVIETGTSSDPFYATDVTAGGHRPSDVGLSCGVSDNSVNTSLGQGKIYCWGSNQYGQMGTGETWSQRTHNRKATPITTTFYRNGTPSTFSSYTAYDVATNGSTVCAIVKLSSSETRNDVMCWGDNSHGEMGIGDLSITESPYPRVLSRTYFDGQVPTKIVGGAARFCAIAGTSNYCWGRDQAAQVGDGVIPVGDEVEPAPKRSAFLESKQSGVVY